MRRFVGTVTYHHEIGAESRDEAVRSVNQVTELLSDGDLCLDNESICTHIDDIRELNPEEGSAFGVAPYLDMDKIEQATNLYKERVLAKNPSDYIFTDNVHWIIAFSTYLAYGFSLGEAGDLANKSVK